MSRPPHAKEPILDAFERILIEEGERAATIDAIARAAGVSKGGLLYHYASKEALELALIDRASALVDADVVAMSTAPEGPVRFFIRTSVRSDHQLDRALVAISRLAQGGHERATAELRSVRDRWSTAIRPHVRDETALALVMLVSDGLYFNNVLGTNTIPNPLMQQATLDALAALVAETVARV